MSILIRDDGFKPEDWPHGFTQNRCEINGDNGAALDLAGDADLSELQRHLNNIGLIRIEFKSFSDGRGFTLARRLRLMGFTRRLRARGPLLADQYAMGRCQTNTNQPQLRQ
ncbi:DUF934 domain-containing protein [Lentibacter sp. XHP0401]|uniref:DUF934 domain-containing protein n=1 Tax=Lentibacter sp. XHP0401 TaxID=2984334 RepID=UPI0021E80FAA|nr:DUF934 domain-containing protein [Lentibacter sp. XHP0401]MCV2892748.1 DUF934 domain-containing protein [Lentibacter sp. XHP0401]